MRSLFPLLLFLFSCAGMIFSLRAEEELRIGDASCGIPSSPLRFALLLLNEKEPGIRISLSRCEEKKGVQLLAAGKLDLLLVNTDAVPKDWQGERQFYGAQALVCYKGAGNPLTSLSLAQLREIWQAKEPTWAPYNGESWNIHRIGVDPFQDDGLEKHFLPPGDFEPKIFRVRGVSLGFPFVSEAALFCGAYLSERSADYPALAVEGVVPDTTTILSGKYPLSLRFEMLWREPEKKSIRLFWEIWRQDACYRVAREAGLIQEAPAKHKE